MGGIPTVVIASVPLAAVVIGMGAGLLISSPVARRWRRNQPAQLIAIAPCSGWTVKYNGRSTRWRPVVAWGLVRAGDGTSWSVGLTTDHELYEVERAAVLTRCDELYGFIGYERTKGC
jgi:hypothetical protein